MPIKIYSSHSTQRADYAFLINPDGTIIDSNVEASFGHVVSHFDTTEFAAYYGKLDDDIDILDIGYTYDTGKYEEPAWDFRKNALVATAIEEMKPLYPELKVFDNETAVLHGVADVRLGTAELDKAEYVRLVERAVQDIIIDGRVLTTPAVGV